MSTVKEEEEVYGGHFVEELELGDDAEEVFCGVDEVLLVTVVLECVTQVT